MAPLYLGGLPPQSSPHPPQMWSATASAGLVGCVRDLVMNGRSVQLAEVARTQDLGQYFPSLLPCPHLTSSCAGSVVSGCQSQGNLCQSQPCQQGGLCQPGWNRYRCDCRLTNYTGPTCARGKSCSNSIYSL